MLEKKYIYIYMYVYIYIYICTTIANQYLNNNTHQYLKHTKQTHLVDALLHAGAK